MERLMNGVRFSKIPQANPKDDRGETWQWPHNRLSRFTTVCVRKAGSISCHFHKGGDPSKNPEQLFIAQGRVKFTFIRFTFSGEALGESKELIAEKGTAISIDPLIIHKTEVLEDAIILEDRVGPFDPKKEDTNRTKIQ